MDERSLAPTPSSRGPGQFEFFNLKRTKGIPHKPWVVISRLSTIFKLVEESEKRGTINIQKEDIKES